jgi:hypothetical protein
MKQPFYKVPALWLIAFLILTGVAMAQESRVGTNAASELLVPVGARYLGMGGSSIASVQGIEAIYWNPAGLARSSHSANAMFSQMRHISDINVSYVAVSATFGSLGTIGLSLKSLDVGDIIVTTENAPDGTGAIISPQFVTTGLTYSRALSDRVNVGATLNIISESIDRVGASGIAIDAGVQYNNVGQINGLSLGVAVKNLGPAMQYDGSGLFRTSRPNGVDRGSTPLQVVAQKDELPTILEIGLGYSIPFGTKSKFDLSSMFQDNNFLEDVGRFGVEYSYNEMFFLRGGYNLSPDAPDDAIGEKSYIYGLTLGAGVHYERPNISMDLNYAYRDFAFFDGSHVFSIALGF